MSLGSPDYLYLPMNRKISGDVSAGYNQIFFGDILPTYTNNIIELTVGKLGEAADFRGGADYIDYGDQG